MIPYEVDGVDVGDGFYRLQRSGVALVNMKNPLATINNFTCLLSVNSIWDTSEDVLDIPAATIQHMLCSAIFFPALRCDLPPTYFAFELVAEDTFIHNVVHTLFVSVFDGYDIEWANAQSAFIHNVVHALFVSVFEGYDIE
ncbi:hypothetical protein BGW39_001759 [Mortierella sp. 14UC]|nr:hypothetical protein BGW39_001759 [Mortierella sp. 14UC]